MIISEENIENFKFYLCPSFLHFSRRLARHLVSNTRLDHRLWQCSIVALKTLKLQSQNNNDVSAQ